MAKEKIIKICDLLIDYGVLAIVFSVPLIIDFSLNSYNTVDLYKAIFFRSVLSVIFLAYIAKIFISGKLSYRGSGLIFILAGWLLLSFFISSIFSLDPNLSFWGDFMRQQGLYNFFNYLVFFILLVLNLKNFRQIKRIMAAVILSASLASVYGLIQYFGLDWIRWSESALSTGRIFSSLGQPNFFGHFLIMVLPVSLYALIFMAKRFWHRLLIALAAGAQLVCLVFTYSRAAWLGFSVAAAAFFLFWLYYQGFKKTMAAAMALTLIAAAAVIGLTFAKPAGQNLNSISLTGRLKSLTDVNSGSNKIRLLYLGAAVQEIKNESYFRLLLGSGPETLALVFTKYYRPEWGVHESVNTVTDRAHNWLFDQLLSLGVLGLVATIIFYAYFIYLAAGRLVKRRPLNSQDWLLAFLFFSLIGYFINNLFSFSLLTNQIYLFLILAVCLFIADYRQAEKTIKIKLTNFSRLFIWLSLSAVLAVFIYTNNINQARAEIYYGKSLIMMKSADCRGGIINLDKALSLFPNNYYYQKNYIYLNLACLDLIQARPLHDKLAGNLLVFIESIKNKRSYAMLDYTARAYSWLGGRFSPSYYDKAEKIYNDLIADYPDIFTAYEYLAKLKAARGDYAAGANYYERAIGVLPPLDHPYLNDQHRRQIEVELIRLYEQAGQANLNLENFDLALDYYNKGLALDPRRATLYKYSADVYYLQGRLDEAIALNQRGLALNPADYHWPLQLFLLYNDKKDSVKAGEYLALALALAPENPELKEYEKELNK
ncbi:MAG: O-antigen ligase family protein [bacterium]|nr:O-antigen ligase family protein [bacterium]